MNTARDPDPRQIVSLDGSSTRKVLAMRVKKEEINIADIAIQWRAAMRTDETIRRNQTSTSTSRRSPLVSSVTSTDIRTQPLAFVGDYAVPVAQRPNLSGARGFPTAAGLGAVYQSGRCCAARRRARTAASRCAGVTRTVSWGRAADKADCVSLRRLGVEVGSSQIQRACSRPRG